MTSPDFGPDDTWTHCAAPSLMLAIPGCGTVSCSLTESGPRRLQDARLPTYSMWTPILYDVIPHGSWSRRKVSAIFNIAHGWPRAHHSYSVGARPSLSLFSGGGRKAERH